MFFINTLIFLPKQLSVQLTLIVTYKTKLMNPTMSYLDHWHKKGYLFVSKL